MFEKLKQLLTTTPILNVADPNLEFEVCTYASKEGLGAMLSQDGKVMAYESRKLKDHEQRYSVYDLELTTMVYVLKIWRHYLLGKRFVLKTNHRSLTSYFKQADLNARQARWNALLREIDFEM